MIKLVAALAVLALDFYIYNHLATEVVYPPRASFEGFERELEGGWQCLEPETIEPKVQENLGVTDYLLCDYQNLDLRHVVNVYVGYHRSQVREEGGGSGENSIHPPAHCLPGSGWDIIASETVPIDFPGLPSDSGTARRLVIAKGEARALVYYWYQSRGRVISQDWRKIVYVGLDRATRGRTDGSLVRFTVPHRSDGLEPAEEALRDLASKVVARLPAYVPE